MDSTTATRTTPRGGHGTYTTAPGDSLKSIAARELGNGERWREIAKLNHLDVSSGDAPIPVDLKLALPAKGADKPEPASLKYSLFNGVLEGKAGGHDIRVNAWSGEGGGSTKEKPKEFGHGVFGILETTVKTKGKGKSHQHGGPLPVGKYKIVAPKRHPHLGLAARLDPMPGNLMLGRDGFYIHGRGKHGSDGCIVPETDFQKIMKAITTSGGGTLEVVAF